MKTLLLVDGSENALRATRYAIALAHANPGMEIHALNVQEPLEPRIRAYLSQQEIDKIEMDAGREALAPSEKLFAEAGVACRFRVRIGSIPESIAQYVDDEHCTAIVMGTRGMSAIANLVMGSVATKVVHAVHVPVTLVK